MIAAPDHPFVGRVGRKGIPIAWLADEVLLVREPGSGTRQVAEQALAEQGLQPRRTVELGSTEAIKHAVAAGLGLAIVSRATIPDELALHKLAILPVQGLEIRRTLTRLKLVGRTPSPAARAFDELLDRSGANLVTTRAD